MNVFPTTYILGPAAILVGVLFAIDNHADIVDVLCGIAIGAGSVGMFCVYLIRKYV